MMMEERNLDDDTRKIMNETTSLVEDALRELFSENNFDGLLESSRYLVYAGGKRMRPLLLMLTYIGLGGRERKAAAKIASLIECLHTFSLIHDDVIDRSETRRGVPSVHTKFGMAAAVLAGDNLTQVIYKIIAEDTDLDLETRMKIVVEFSRCCIRMIEGEYLDVEFEHTDEVTEHDYMKQAQGKSASLLEHSMRIGAIMAGASQDVVKTLGEFGASLGCAFQIQDDILDLTANPAELGKPVGQDIREGKKTLITIHALNRANASDKKEILETLGKPELTNEEIRRTISLLSKYGSMEYAKSIAMNLVGRAKTCLKPIILKPIRKSLEELADMVVSRTA